MTRGRLVTVSLVVTAMAVMVSMWDGRRASSSSEQPGLGIASAGTTEEVSSTWFCAAGRADIEPTPRHYLYLTNTASEKMSAVITAYGVEGRIGSSTVDLGSRTAAIQDMDKAFGPESLSVMVEASGGALTVSHALMSDSAGDRIPCVRESSSEWYFPSQTTLAGSTAHLVLFNPFSSDAGVDISAAVADGLRSPPEWAGMVVPAGSSRVVNIADEVQIRDQISLTVKSRSGRVFAETVQSFSGVAIEPVSSVDGLRLMAGVSRAAAEWVFAGGFKDPGAAESLVIQNTGSDPVRAKVQITPYGATSLPPEPFEVTVPARRYTVLELAAEGRVPEVGFHTITVEAERGRSLVVARRLRINGPAPAGESGVPVRPDVESGVTASHGVTGPARNWLLPSISTGPSDKPLAFIHNPGRVDTRVTVTSIDDEGSPVVVAEDVVIPAGEGLVLGLSPGDLVEAGLRFYEVASTQPVMVEQFITMGEVPDMSLVSALPVAD